MRNLQLDFAHDGVAPLVQQVVVVVDGTCGGVLDGDGPAVNRAGLDALENLFERVHWDDFDIVSEQVVGGTFAVGPATALECNFLHALNVESLWLQGNYLNLLAPWYLFL